MVHLREIGFFTDLKILDAGPLRSARKQRDYDILGLGSAYRMDPHEDYYKELSSKSAAAANYGGWVNPVYDQIIDDAARTPEKQERIKLYTEAENSFTKRRQRCGASVPITYRPGGNLLKAIVRISLAI
jgi:ABC-type transport system substrate-binding protein